MIETLMEISSAVNNNGKMKVSIDIEYDYIIKIKVYTVSFGGTMERVKEEYIDLHCDKGINNKKIDDMMQFISNYNTK